MSENQNQNNINTTQNRLEEMKDIKTANQKILDDINLKTAALAKDKSDFDAYKQSVETKIADDRKLLARESGNHAKLDTVAMQKQIDALSDQVTALAKENEELRAHIAE